MTLLQNENKQLLLESSEENTNSEENTTLENDF